MLPELKKETRFADLLIIGGEVFYKDLGGKPNTYLKTILHDAECPVVVVPEEYEYPEKIVLAYDGSESSVYAIKQFSYLFPVLSHKKTVLVYADENDKIEFPDQDYLEELAARHYPDLAFFKLETNPYRGVKEWLEGRKATLLVSGSYGRSGFSQLFRKSFINDLILEHKIPVFVTHV